MFEHHTNCRQQSNRRSSLPLKLLMAALFTGGNLVPALSVLAAPPAPGTIIQNQATGSFVNLDDSSTTNIESNIVQVQIAEVAGITVSGSAIPTEAPSGVTGAGPQQGNGAINAGDVVYFTYTITNVGNDPTQFFIPGAPSNLTNGTLQGNIQIIGFDPDGSGSTSATDLSSSPVTIPGAGALTGSLTIPGLAGGSLPAGGTLTVRVPVKVSTSATAGTQVTVVLGDTTPVNQQNQPFSDGGNNHDLYTEDNSGTDNGDTNGDPINGDATNHRQEASFSQQTTVTEAIDYGDAPDTYGTDNTSGNSSNSSDPVGANHTIVNGIHLGSTAPDAESDGQPTIAADSDGAEDDGPTIGGTSLQNLTLTAGNATTIDVATTGSGKLYGWIDWDGDGTFGNNANEVIVAETTDATGTRNISVTPPAGLTAGTSYARFRYSTDDLTNQPGGLASDGEVEDYAVALASTPPPMGPSCISPANTTFNSTNYSLNTQIQNSAPLTFYNATMGVDFTLTGGASFNAGIQVLNDPAPGFGQHLLVQAQNTNSFLTSNRRATYVFSFPTPVTDFSMVAGGLNNDDGTYIIASHKGVPVQITAANFSNLSTAMIFMDADGDGQSDTVVSRNQDNDPGVITNTYNLSIPGPVDEVRIVTGKEDNNGGNVTLGFLSIGYCANPDYGDAPLSYDDTDGGGTLDGNDSPAQHAIASTLYLGTVLPDAETAPQSSAAADGDDAISAPAVDDEDGITTFPNLNPSTTDYSVTATVNNTNNVPANVYAWIDFDRDGEFDEDERAANATVAANSTNAQVTLNWSNIGSSGPDITAGASYVRIRVTTDDLDTSTETTDRDDASVGSAIDGEVEDYPLEIQAGPVFPPPPVTGPGDGNECVLTHHQNPGTVADPNSFYSISDHTAPSTLELIGPWDVPSGTVEGLTADPGTGTFYALNANRSGSLFLGTIDPATGSFSDITTTGITSLSHSSLGTLNVVQSRAMAFQPGTNIIWAAAYLSQPTSGLGNNFFYLFQIDASTGDPVANAFGAGNEYLAIDLAPYTMSSSQSATIEALAFYPGAPNLLYGVVSTDRNAPATKIGHLFAVDVSAANPSAVLAPKNLEGTDFDGSTIITSNIYDIEGMSFDDNGDLVIVSSNVGGTNANSLFFVDLATGAASGKRTIVSGDWEGIACNAPLPVASDPNLLLVKRITKINNATTTINGDNLAIYNPVSAYPYDDNLIEPALAPNLPAFPTADTDKWPGTVDDTSSTFLIGGNDGGETSPDDEVEYTIYFLSAGSQDATNVQLCDRIPDNQVFVPDAYNAAHNSATGNTGGFSGSNRGITIEYNGQTLALTNDADGDIGQFYPPNSTLPAACNFTAGQTQDNGAVVVNLGNLPRATAPGTPGDSYGLIRFRANVK